MSNILITGLAGTGKSVLIDHLTQLGYPAVDASQDEWSEWRRVRPAGSDVDGSRDEWVWREDRFIELLANRSHQTLFVAGCAANQGKFHSQFEQIILLTARPERMIERLEPRWDLRIATDRFERYQVLQSVQRVLPLLRKTADVEIDTTNRGVEEIADLILDRCATVSNPGDQARP
ncbi:MAG TPA: AAA family ATPase [Thermomicrobiales bacterium]|nr:AAA family ATPase [Thermomicrobiales bacterium]